MFLDTDALAVSSPSMLLPHYEALRDLTGVQARFFTARNAEGKPELDCRIKTPELAQKNAANREAVAQAFGVSAERLLSTRLGLSAATIVVGNGWRAGLRPEHEAMVKAGGGDAVLCLLTCDCAPVLFADPVNRVIGAAHAGWRQVADNILEKTVEAMTMLGAERRSIRAAIGPCAGVLPDTYEVARGFAQEGPNRDPKLAGHLMEKGGKTFFAFQNYIAERVAGLGVSAVERVRVDTLVDEGCYSFRRNGKDRGAMISGITMQPV